MPSCGRGRIRPICRRRLMFRYARTTSEVIRGQNLRDKFEKAVN